jgi:glutamate--cysteine ligase
MTTTIQGGAELDEEARSADDVVRHIERCAKHVDDHLFGIEYERLGVYRASGKAIPYDDGVERILDRVAEIDGWERGLEDGRIIFLKKGAEMVTLEPGGQTEYSSAPARTIAELMEKARHFGRVLDTAAAEFGIVYLGIGYHPFSTPEEIPWTPKRRYAAMAPYLTKKGALAHEMMKMTAGCQVALDYRDAENAMKMVRVASLATPFAQALFAASGIGRGKPLDWIDWRARIWTETDDARCNIPEFMLRKGSTVEEYVDWLMEMPLMFLEEDGCYRDGTGFTLRRLMMERRVTIRDVEMVMTQAFPEVRIKRFIEVRSIDSPTPRLLATVPCFWSSLLYGDLDAVCDLLGHLEGAEFLALRETAMKEGLKGRHRGRSIGEWTRDILSIGKRTATCARSFEILEERANSEVTPAEEAQKLLARNANYGEFVENWG